MFVKTLIKKYKSFPVVYIHYQLFNVMKIVVKKVNNNVYMRNGMSLYEILSSLISFVVLS